MDVEALLVDAHPAFRDGLRAALESAGIARVVGEAGDGVSAVQMVAAMQPDVVLIDVTLNGSSGIEATRRITGGPHAPHVLVISAVDDDDAVIGALRAGAKGFIDKAVSREELLHGIHLVAHGGAAFSPSVADRLPAYFSALHEVPGRVAFPDLTDRETQILELLACGYDNRSISRRLVLAEKTIRNHITRIFTKLDVPDRMTAALRARNAGLGLEHVS
ncbi:response regulator transcription factor [Nonomuraea zeae]|uniref:Response regulator transcription factor n=2 Tax=Nonomuraea zeae TaxID=1642303 RepID=A0A5S4H593_9ACTN|nr:response regulator transcription factor [Nonomuraea zeae]